MSWRPLFYSFILLVAPWEGSAKLPDISPRETTDKLKEIMQGNATYKTLTPVLIKRALQNYLDELDPVKSYFIEEDISAWLDPSEALIEKILSDYQRNKFDTFVEINTAMIRAIKRRHELEKQIDYAALPKKVPTEEFKNIPWAKNEAELVRRISRIK